MSWPSPRSPVMTAVTPRSLSHKNSRRSSARSIAWFVKPENKASKVSRTTRLAPIESIAKSETHKQAFEVELSGLFNLTAFDAYVIDDN